MRAVLVALALALAGEALAQPIPASAERYRRDVIRNARLVWGLTAPIATFGAQIHQESTWSADAVSPVGARGLAQFMPGTADWISGLYDDLGDNQPHNPAWAIRALVRYDWWLYERITAATTCERMAKVLSSYNGGLGWLQRDERLAKARGLDEFVWFNNVENMNAGRSAAAWAENRGYVRRILHVLEPRYRTPLWGVGSCQEVPR